MKKGVLVVVSGPSGVGKGTVLTELFAMHPQLSCSVSATTREPRVGEVHGQDYFFISRENFCDLIKKGALLEHTEYCGNFYGTLRSEVDTKISRGLDIVLEIDIDGARAVREATDDSVQIFILPPSFHELAQRLSGRGTESSEQAATRLCTAKNELAEAPQYDYIVVNGDPKDCAQEIFNIIQAEKCCTSRMKFKLKEVLGKCASRL